MSIVINYDPSYKPNAPWLVFNKYKYLSRWHTLELAIEAVITNTKNQPYQLALIDYKDGSWGIVLIEDVTDILPSETLLGTYPYSELRYILQTYGQMLPCKYQS